MKRSFKPLSFLLALLLGLQVSLPSAAIFAAGEDGVYFRDYNDGIISGWTAASGTATFTAEDGAVKVATQGRVILADLESPAYADGEYELKLKFNAVPSRFGFVYRFVDDKNYNVIQYDNGGWGWDSLQKGSETYGDIPSTSPAFEAGKQYTFKLRFTSDSVQLWVDGASVLTASLPSLPTGAGKIGLRSWYDNKIFTIDDLKVTKVEVTTPKPKPITLTDTLVSDAMTVEIDKEFPRVKKYVWNSDNAAMNGQLNGVNELKVNNMSYYPVATSYVKKEAAEGRGQIAAYSLEIPEIEVKLDVELELKDNVLNFNVVNLEENGTELVKTVEFPNQDLVSIVATEPKAQETAVLVPGSWNNISEERIDLKSANVSNVRAGRTYAFLNNDKLAASVITNTVNDDNKVTVRVADDAALGAKKAAISPGTWTYRGSLVLDPEPLPWAKVVLTRDANNDGIVDWQDGAIAYRNVADAPYKSELIRDNISYISMNIGSTTSSPFLRAFDNAKKISNLTDGFGQIILFKGYQAEGHDDSHPDYGGHIGIRQGGVEDFNFVLSEGKKYNIKGGVHINATEYMTDAYEFKIENMNMPLSKGWGWLDQAYYVNKMKDLESGELKRRLDMLKEDTGDNLSFVYVDVYTGNDYAAKKLSDYINGNGWMLGTEFAGPLYNQTAWVHWGTDPGYPNQGNSSEVIRFLRNDTLDGFLTTPLLKGNKQVGVGYWQNSSSFYSYKDTTAAFFNHNLPTKYMQYFPIIKMAKDRIDFEGNVAVERKSDGKIHLSKDGNEIAIMTDSSNISNSTVFIPWNPITEDKIYHWNPAGGSTTWTLPASWSEVQTAQLYKLTDLGREHVGSVPVTDGKVTLAAEKGIGYVLYPGLAEDQEEMVWGDGGHVKDPGFDSQKFGNWKKYSTAGTTDHIQFVKNNNADDQLQVTGPGDATIEQTLTGLTPGKSYSASVWVSVNGKRKVEIGVKQGDEETVNYLDNTEHPYYAQQHKYLNAKFQRIKVTFEAVSDTALFSMKVEGGNAAVLFDDVKIWENPTKTEAGDSIFFEDFENVDEGWGPFVYAKLGPVRTHLVEKRNNQYFTYVLDGSWSLKTNEEGTGEWLRTLPHTLRLEEDNRYHLTMDYNSDEKDMYSVAIRVKENGVVRELASASLLEGKNTLDLQFATEGAKDAYLAIIKNKINNAKELTGTLVVDNIRVDDEGPIMPEEGVLVEKVTIASPVMEMLKGQTAQIIARVEPANAFDRSLAWSSDKPEIVSVDQTGKVTAHALGTAVITATSKDGGNISATATISVFEPNEPIPQSQMKATASSFEPGDEPSNALDGDPSTHWHTKWSPAHLPESITLDLGGTYMVNQLNYTPRVGAGNGTITAYNLYGSTDGVNFELITSGTWVRNEDVKKVRFDAVSISHLKLEATAGMGNFASAAELNVFRLIAETGSPATVLSAPASVEPGANFEVTLGLANIKDKVFAQDIVVEYDANAMEFIGAESMIPGVSVIDSATGTAGILRFIIASAGEGNEVTGNADLLKLRFKAKDVAETVTGSVAVTKAELANDLGEESSAGLSAISIEIAKPTGIPGDMNEDGRVSVGDLAMIAYHYGKTDKSPDWQQAKKADINGDGIVDLEDLVIVARAIVE